MVPIAHLGDRISHGGEIISASPNVFAQNVAVARVGDWAWCSRHGRVIIVTGANTVLINNQPAAHHDSLCSCGAKVISHGTVLVNPA